MMKLSLSIFLSATVLLLSGVSCTREAPVPGGRISMTLSTADPETKAGSGDPADGGGIAVDANGDPDLVIAIADQTGALVAWYPDDFWGAMATGYSSDCLTLHQSSTPSSESTVFISGPGRGNYTVLALANTSGLPDGVLSSLAAESTLAGLESVYLSVASGEPSFGASMPLSAKGSLSVNSNGNGHIDLALLRPVARVSLTFRNMTGNPGLEIHSASAVIHEMNPSRGYLFPQTSDYISGFDRDITLTGDDPLVFSDNKSTLPEKQVFPSIAPVRAVGSRYLCDISFRVTKSGKTYDSSDPSTFDAYDFTDLPVHDSRSADIHSLKRNQFLRIETRISRNAHNISFNFEVQGWDEKTEQVFFH